MRQAVALHRRQQGELQEADHAGKESCETADSPMPVRTKKPVMNRPKSIAELLELSMKSSGFAHRPHIQLGRGATM